MPDHFEARIRASGEQVTVALVGELDVAGVGHLHRVMDEAGSLPVTDVVVDARWLTFVDGRGLRALASEIVALRRAGPRVQTINLRDPAVELATLLEVETLLDVQSGDAPPDPRGRRWERPSFSTVVVLWVGLQGLVFALALAKPWLAVPGAAVLLVGVWMTWREPRHHGAPAAVRGITVPATEADS